VVSTCKGRGFHQLIGREVGGVNAVRTVHQNGFRELQTSNGAVVEILLGKQVVNSRDHVGDRWLIKC
jgi:hypothetical protein